MTGMSLDRRQFLKVSGLAAAGAIASACTSDKPKATPGATTTTEPTTTSSGASPSDVALIKTATSLEALATQVYQRASGAALVKDPAVLDATTLFLMHHTAHQVALNDLLQAAEVSPVTAPNNVLDKSIFQPALAAATSQADVIQLLLTLEEVLTQTYVYSADTLTKPEHRALFMSIAGTQARHRALIGFAFAKRGVEELFPSSFAKSSNPLPPDAIVS